MKLTKLLFLIGLSFCFFKSKADIYLDFSNYRIGTSANIKIIGGVVSGIDFDNQLSISDNQFGNGQVVTNIYDSTGVSGSSIQYFGINGMDFCPNGWEPTAVLSKNDYDIFAEWVNKYIAQQPILYFMRGIIPSYKYYQYPGVRWMRFNCYLSSGKWVSGMIKTNGTQIIVPPPQENESVCRLNGQELNVEFIETNLNVDGISKRTNLIVSCTNGDARNYQLKLVGNNVINGLLDFGNGVKAKVFLNDTQIEANGSGVLLNNLTSGTIPINVILVGSAFDSGVNHSNGIFILDAL